MYRGSEIGVRTFDLPCSYMTYTFFLHFLILTLASYFVASAAMTWSSCMRWRKKKGKKSWILFIELGSFVDVSFQYEREEWAAFNPDLDTVTSFWGGPGETHCDQSGRLRILFYSVVWVILWQSWGLRLELLYKKTCHCLLTWSISTTWPCALHNKKHL